MFKNKTFKLVNKILLVVFLTLLMCENFVEGITSDPTAGRVIHAVMGYITLALIIFHFISNIGFFKSLNKGKWNGKRIALVITNGLMMLFMVLILLSGMMIMLEKVFKVLDLGGFPTKMHTLASYYLYLLLGIHVALNIRLKKGLVPILVCCGLVIYGVVSFILLKYYQVIFFYNIYSHSMDNMFLQLLLLPGILCLGFGITEIINMLLQKDNNKKAVEEKEETE